MLLAVLYDVGFCLLMSGRELDSQEGFLGWEEDRVTTATC